MTLIAFALIFTSCLVISAYLDGKMTIIQCMVFVGHYGLALIQRCPSLEERQDLHKWTYWLLSMFGMFVFIAYTCDLTAEMTTSDKERFPETFSQVIQNDYEIYVMGGKLPEAILKEAAVGSPQKVMYEKNVHIYQYPPEGNMENIIEEIVYKPRRAFFGTAEQFIGDSRLMKLASFKDQIENTVHLAFKKDSDIKEFFNFHLAKLIQSGTVSQLEHKWRGQDKPKDDMSNRIFIEDFRPVGSKNLIFPSMTLLICTIASFLTAIFEVFRFQCQSKLLNIS